MEHAGTDGRDEVDADLVELEALEREIAALEAELTAVDGSVPEVGDDRER